MNAPRGMGLSDMTILTFEDHKNKWRAMVRAGMTTVVTIMTMVKLKVMCGRGEEGERRWRGLEI